MLYGLQRSGTNAVEVFLESNYGVGVQAEAKGDRGSPHHKHFRVYDDRRGVPDPQYASDAPVVATLAELDDLLGAPRTTKYVLVRKTPEAWLPSIRRWALKHKWPRADTPSLLRDYKLWWDKWTALAATDPRRVHVVEYDDFLLNGARPKTPFHRRLARFLQRPVPDRPAMPERVPQSAAFSADRKEHYVAGRFRDELTADDRRLLAQFFPRE